MSRCEAAEWVGESLGTGLDPSIPIISLHPPSQYHSLGDTYTYASDITLFMITHYFYSGCKISHPEIHWISSLFDWYISGSTLENRILYLWALELLVDVKWSF